MPPDAAPSDRISCCLRSSYAAVAIAAATVSERGAAPGAERLLVARLAIDAADRGRLGAQPAVVDVAPAIPAHAVSALVEASARLVQLAQLAHVARHFGLVHLGYLARDRLVARIRRRPGQLAERIGARPAQVLAQ